MEQTPQSGNMPKDMQKTRAGHLRYGQKKSYSLWV